MENLHNGITDRFLQICGMEVEEEQIQVHFTDKCTNGALVVLGKVEDGDITVDIPNELLKEVDNPGICI